MADPSIDELLALAKAQFASGVRARVAAITGAAGRSAWEEVRRGAHKLRGAAATYGFAALGATAGEIEEALIDARDRPGPELCVRLGALVGKLEGEASRVTGEGS